MINEASRRGIKYILCPDGKEDDLDKDLAEKGKFHKKQFHYDHETDTIICPEGKKLIKLYTTKPIGAEECYSVYGDADCLNCFSREKCTKSPNGRRIKRYPCDDIKEAILLLMTDPVIKAIFLTRKTLVERVFSELRTIQNFNRFLRKGIEGASLEFGLHIIAYNLFRVCHILGYKYLENKKKLADASNNNSIHNFKSEKKFNDTDINANLISSVSVKNTPESISLLNNRYQPYKENSNNLFHVNYMNTHYSDIYIKNLPDKKCRLTQNDITEGKTSFNIMRYIHSGTDPP
jgi:hypothetical protein